MSAEATTASIKSSLAVIPTAPKGHEEAYGGSCRQRQKTLRNLTDLRDPRRCIASLLEIARPGAVVEKASGPS